MNGVLRKFSGAALAALLFFCACFPVPVGVRAFDDLRIQRAEAVVPAIPVILGTIAAAGGLVVAGGTLTSYDANLNALYNGFSSGTNYWTSAWSDYVSDKGSFDNALNSFVTAEGNISLQTVYDAGLFDSLHSYSVYCVDNGSAVLGSSSSDALVTQLALGSFSYATFKQWPVIDEEGYVSNEQNLASNGFTFRLGYMQSDSSIVYYYSRSDEINAISQNSSGLLTKSNVGSFTVSVSNGSYTFYAPTTSTRMQTAAIGGTGNVVLLNPDLSYTLSNGDVGTFADVDGYEAVVSDDLYDGTATYPTSTVEAFEPTAAQLEAGYSSADIVEAVNTQTGTLEGIQNFLTQHLPVLGSILGVVTGIASSVTGIASDVAGFLSQAPSWLSTWWQTLSGNWASLLEWAGDTPFGNVMQTVIDGVQAIPDGIRNVGDTLAGGLEGVLEGVQAIPGQLSGVLDGILEGVQAIPDSIASVIDAVQAGVVDLTGALDASLHPVRPSGGGGFAAPTYMDEETFDDVLRDKAPFAYMFAFKETMDSAVESYSNSPSFRIRHTFDFFGNQVEYDINAEPWLNRDIGGVTIAQLLRSSVTITLCMGVLVAAYKTALAAVKG